MDTWKQRQQTPITIVAVIGSMTIMHKPHAAQVVTAPAHRPECLVWNSQPASASLFAPQTQDRSQVLSSPPLTEMPITEFLVSGTDELNLNPLQKEKKWRFVPAILSL